MILFWSLFATVAVLLAIIIRLQHRLWESADTIARLRSILLERTRHESHKREPPPARIPILMDRRRPHRAPPA